RRRSPPPSRPAAAPSWTSAATRRRSASRWCARARPPSTSWRRRARRWCRRDVAVWSRRSDAARGGAVSSHTISVRLENRPGALARVSQLFSRRGYNIQSLAVGPTERPDISRLTLRVDCSEHSLEQIEKQMHKLVNVLRVTELVPDESVERELALFTVSVGADRRSELVALSQVAGARIADIGRDAVTFEFVGRPDQVEAFEELVRPYGV